MSWVPMKEEISKTKFGAIVLKLTPDVLAKKFCTSKSKLQPAYPGFLPVTQR